MTPASLDQSYEVRIQQRGLPQGRAIVKSRDVAQRLAAEVAQQYKTTVETIEIAARDISVVPIVSGQLQPGAMCISVQRAELSHLFGKAHVSLITCLYYRDWIFVDGSDEPIGQRVMVQRCQACPEEYSIPNGIRPEWWMIAFFPKGREALDLVLMFNQM